MEILLKFSNPVFQNMGVPKIVNSHIPYLFGYKKIYKNSLKHFGLKYFCVLCMT